MSARHNIQDATGVIVRHPVKGVTQVAATTTPTNAAVGYAPGCLWQNTKATVLGTFLYVNTGTKASATWTNIV